MSILNLFKFLAKSSQEYRSIFFEDKFKQFFNANLGKNSESRNIKAGIHY